MDLWLVILVVAIVVLSRPVVSRLWRAGRLSDRSLTLLVIGRFPAVVGLIAVLSGASPQVVLFAVAIAVLSGVFFYRFARDLVHERSGADRA